MESGNCTILSNALFKHRDTLTLSHKLHLHLFVVCGSVSDYRNTLEKMIQKMMIVASFLHGWQGSLHGPPVSGLWPPQERDQQNKKVPTSIDVTLIWTWNRAETAGIPAGDAYFLTWKPAFLLKKTRVKILHQQKTMKLPKFQNRGPHEEFFFTINSLVKDEAAK